MGFTAVIPAMRTADKASSKSGRSRSRKPCRKRRTPAARRRCRRRRNSRS